MGSAGPGLPEQADGLAASGRFPNACESERLGNPPMRSRRRFAAIRRISLAMRHSIIAALNGIRLRVSVPLWLIPSVASVPSVSLSLNPPVTSVSSVLSLVNH